MNDPERLIFEISTPGARAIDTPPCDVPYAEIDPAIASFVETELPEVGQLDLVRHYTRLSNRLFCVDTNFYPLGSCTMKYNPKVNERLAHHSGWEWLHPLQRDEEERDGRRVLTPEPAQGTTPASAAAAGASVVTVRSTAGGLLDVGQLEA